VPPPVAGLPFPTSQTSVPEVFVQTPSSLPPVMISATIATCPWSLITGTLNWFKTVAVSGAASPTSTILLKMPEPSDHMPLDEKFPSGDAVGGIEVRNADAHCR